eukprot:gene22764-15280_t
MSGVASAGGRGVDFAAAVAAHRTAAARGHPGAQLQLALFCEFGLGQ